MDKLPGINVEATKEKLDEVFRQYRTYQFTLPEEMLPTITPKYTLEMPAFTGLVNSKTENAAIRNVDFQRRAEKFFDQFNRALYKLSKKEREIIAKAYLDEAPRFNYEIANELHLSERTYFRIKSKALYTFALGMRVVVYQDEEVTA